jgi:hypothetical protein
MEQLQLKQSTRVMVLTTLSHTHITLTEQSLKQLKHTIFMDHTPQQLIQLLLNTYTIPMEQLVQWLSIMTMDHLLLQPIHTQLLQHTQLPQPDTLPLLQSSNTTLMAHHQQCISTRAMVHTMYTHLYIILIPQSQ